MPNWVENVVTAPNIEKLDIYQTDDYGDKVIDFNKIIPMPESLNVTSGSSNDTDIMSYLTQKGSLNIHDLDPESLNILTIHVQNMFDSDWLNTVYGRLCDLTPQDKQASYESGKMLVDNINKYGFATWYDWSIDTWGTKWNASSGSVSSNLISFQTAWSAPIPVIVALSKQYPDITFEHKYADEDASSNTGCLTYLNGEIISVEFPEHDTPEAWAIYMELWGLDDYYRKLDDGRYRYCDPDDYN